MLKKVTTTNMGLNFDSEDTDQSDLSYDSSFDEKEDNQGQSKEQKNISLFKEQMVRFLLTNPELKDSIKLGKDIISEQAAATPIIAGQSSSMYRNPMWESIAGNLFSESKKMGTMPSIESFSQRLNLFREKISKPDAVEMVLMNKDSLLKQIKKEEERKAKVQNRIHETIEAKLRKEQGDVKYYSKLKKNQFDSRMQKEEAKVRSAVNNNTGVSEKAKEVVNSQPQAKNQSEHQSQLINEAPIKTQSSGKGIRNASILVEGRLGTMAGVGGSLPSTPKAALTTLILQQQFSIDQRPGSSVFIAKNLRFQQNGERQNDLGREELDQRILNSQNPIIKNNLALSAKALAESQSQYKQFKARPVPGVFERLSQDNVKKNQQINEAEVDDPLDIEFKTVKGEQLYREIRKKEDDEEEMKRYLIKYLVDHRAKVEEEFKAKPSILGQGLKYYSEESKEFSLLSPNFLAKKKMTDMFTAGTLTEDFFDHRANLEDGNIYLLTKVSKILKGNIMRKWKSIQDQKF